MHKINEENQKTSLGAKIFVSFFLVILLLGIGISTIIQNILTKTLKTEGVETYLVNRIVNQFTITSLGFIMIAMVLTFIIAFILSRSISKPLTILTKTAQDITAGDLSKRAVVKSNDEIGQLAQSFNTSINALVDAKTKVETILHNIGDAVFVIDNKYRIIVFNKTSCELSGYTTKEAIGQKYDKILKFIYEDSKKINNVFIRECIEGGKLTSMANHTLLVRKDGIEIPVEDSAAPLKDSAGNIMGCAVVFRDVSQSREVDKMKSEFVSLASHQLRTPLTAIKLFTEMLSNKDTERLSEEQKEYIKAAHESTDRMAKLVNELLNISRLETGKLKIEPNPVNLITFIQDIIEETDALAKKHKCKILFIKPEKNSITALIDPTLVRQVIHNLLMNAIRYSTDKITINLEEKIDNYQISIQDRGIGIPREIQGRIFEKFFRADNAQKITSTGSGLGLYLAKMITRAFGGKIWFKSKKGEGSTFFVSIPKEGMKKEEGGKSLIKIN
ncbi:hypothetical protein A2331_05420 [Candidatus Falkowbacteria bacterium RIFOXYB2_FULL_34_18]|uniref:histidine kinase n=1 Tax=Candidatus Falkowbacteria bacterium RIFOXYD2_FULL_34_120 TaxID=1798007 RepID=A0A1F5TQH5_9BACT|nr:MAG: hypothetical protein A2331_05420 [Candidatus Falkowbacteria bacterium RIFOXYB2_FULL_34_18]OGF29487.1 MAG: hypothetical protein A2500_04285 [Candidatus Falkowbacteria bacterium RIFOXYC12_FULL_34_55]OGF36304.1 MAG: hypothetical protein A2466_05295 [Candidatus Falkowbacteria bacterium RIFOXYC2_FULL_34_220]OGF39013.1 MAG: hypothetical protein A2515_06750 [Candidatus Falkowbacteria bacterium RIFOXYD12_FULL_34_57]OGF41232.1 MAG: hypothetical protein A2531_00990 [Candidatus Falkowbacteria bact